MNLIFGLGGQELLVIFLFLFVFLVPLYFMVKILLSKLLSTEKKILWILAVWILSFIGLTVFYFSDDYKKI